jgi:hypothetical protein
MPAVMIGMVDVCGSVKELEETIRGLKVTLLCALFTRAGEEKEEREQDTQCHRTVYISMHNLTLFLLNNSFSFV